MKDKSILTQKNRIFQFIQSSGIDMPPKGDIDNAVDKMIKFCPNATEIINALVSYDSISSDEDVENWEVFAKAMENATASYTIYRYMLRQAQS